MYIASTKIPEREGSVSPFRFYGKPPDYKSHVFSLAYPVDKSSFKEMRTWDWFKITFYCIYDWCESKIRRQEFKILLCNPWWKPSKTVAKHQRPSYHAKTVNSLNTLTVPAKELHHRTPIAF